ncbi:MAG: SsrA-binding protein SmpB [Candidatus Omnitrophica bacterium]|nr:SsrA-binding protein SmpB [Candidatus Omnitrophota bacterium]
MKIIANNKKAHRDYIVLETIEAGIELRGSEVKSLRSGGMSLNDSFARIEGNQVILYNTHISPYKEASYFNVEPARQRRLLLHKRQIQKLTGALTQRGLTLIPLKAYFSQNGFAKIELALCKGKKLYDRREDLKRREADLAIKRAMKGRRSK